MKKVQILRVEPGHVGNPQVIIICEDGTLYEMCLRAVISKVPELTAALQESHSNFDPERRRLEMQKSRASGMTIREIARQFGLSESRVRDFVR